MKYTTIFERKVERECNTNCCQFRKHGSVSRNSKRRGRNLKLKTVETFLLVSAYAGLRLPTCAFRYISPFNSKDKKPFTDGDFVKKCMMAAVESVCSEKIKLFFGFSFSARTITRQIGKISENVKYKQKDCFKDLQFSIAINESTDTTDTAQLAVFVSGVNGNFYVVENFVQLLPMMGTTTGTDILKPLLQS